MGTITVGFHAVAVGKGLLPLDEPEIRSLATAAGLPADANYSETLVTAVGKVRQVVSIRYSKADGLPAGEPPVAGVGR